jgi:hypothetical protein
VHARGPVIFYLIYSFYPQPADLSILVVTGSGPASDLAR